MHSIHVNVYPCAQNDAHIMTYYTIFITHMTPLRSVEDELKRESYADAGVVASSYAAMLIYIAVALGAVPPPSQPARVLVLSRAGLGAAGVAIVACSVAGAIGLVSMAGLWSTLIIMEVIPFLVLAVGVDNMFVLAHALSRQVCV
jgi:Niemann-Pick C1 protein